MKSLKALVIGSLAFALLHTAYGNVTIQVSLGDFFQSDEITALNEGVAGALVISKDDDLFADSGSILGSTLSVGNTLGGNDDEIVAISDSIDFSPDFGTNFDFVLPNLEFNDGIDDGDLIGFFFFETLTSGDVVTAGSNYGFFRTDDTLSLADSSWELPNSGSIISLFAFTDVDGISNSTFSTNLTAVPEPSTIAGIAGALVLMIWFHRRRKAR
ncbi:PEP-CTERM sorting domain-containing protein [Puniceicoccaceae bacterium K14]|nr:PEP-CTERM sorting domain-containing protein [Puniceicoccaceae bacterium K14]